MMMTTAAMTGMPPTPVSSSASAHRSLPPLGSKSADTHTLNHAGSAPPLPPPAPPSSLGPPPLPSTHHSHRTQLARLNQIGLDIPPFVAEHMRGLGKTAKISQGLENELKKCVNSYIFEQHLYARDLSEDRLACRMASLSNEKTLLQYSFLFDRESLASALDTVNYIVGDNPIYKTFQEFFQFQKTLAALQKQIRVRKKQILQHASTTTESSSSSRRNSISLRSPGNNIFKDDQDGKSPSASQRDEVSLGQVTVEREETRNHTRESRTITETLGMEYDHENLQDDLATDYSLDIYNYNYRHDIIAVDDKSMGVKLYGKQSDYDGFNLVEADLYARVNNPYMILNEVGAIRFNDTLHCK